MGVEKENHLTLHQQSDRKEEEKEEEEIPGTSLLLHFIRKSFENEYV